MKIKTTFMRTALWFLITASCFPIFAQGNVPITYQGQLLNNGSPANGLYSLTFTLYTNSSGGTALGAVTHNSVAVTNGLFTTVLLLNTNVYGDKDYTNWLELGVATNGSSVFTTLVQRQQLTFVPFAINALNAGTAAIATSAMNWSGSVSGDVSGTQGATVVTSVGGQPATNIASGVIAANSATSSNIPGTIIARDGSGNFSAGSVTLGGSLHLPFPTVIYSGTNTLLIEKGDLYVGSNAGNNAGSDGGNVGLGDDVLSSGSTGQWNVGVGEDSLEDNTLGSANAAVGFETLADNTVGDFNTAIGFLSLVSNTTGNNNTATGSQALSGNTTGNNNTASGANALWNNASGAYNTANGANALSNNMAGSYNTANGFSALYDNDGSYNTANGYEALYSSSFGNQNTANGYQALYSNVGGYQNSANGSRALFNNTSGYFNTADGAAALQANTSGYGNTADGAAALQANTSGSGNTAYGEGALIGNTNGIYNTALGLFALQNNGNGSNNIALGVLAGYQIASGSYNIDIGNPGVSTDNNVIRIGTQGTGTNAPTEQTNTFIAGIYGTVISGGLPVYVNSSGQLGSSTVVSGFSLQVGVDNHVTNSYSSIAGGTNNTISADESSILGGYFNAASGAASSVDGGSGNTASGDHSVVAAGEGNIASGTHSFVGAGLGNSASSDEDVIVGGISNAVAGDPSFIGAGQNNRVGSFSGTGISGIAINSFIVAGAWNQVFADDSGIGGGYTNFIGTNANYSFIGGGFDNLISSGITDATIGGGSQNLITNGSYSIVGGGQNNNIRSSYSVIGGGIINTIGIGANNGFIGGGSNNFVSGVDGAVPGGESNVAGGFASFAAGRSAHALNDNTFVWSDGSSGVFSSTANNQFLIQATNGVGINTASPQQALSVVGGMNIDQNSQNNGTVHANALTFGGGSGEGIASQRTSGASQDSLDFYTDFSDRMIILNNGDVGIGEMNPAGALHITGPANTPPSSQPSGDNGLVLGTTGTSGYKWIQSFGGPLILNPTSNNVGIGTTTPAYTLDVNGNINASGKVYANGVALTSDRNAKENFTVINPQEVLAKVAALPVTEWNYKTESKDVQHLGPMAQDFQAAFGLDGADDKHISVVDEGGVALAAIQGLNQKLGERDTEIQTLKQQNDSLAARLNELESAVKQLSAQK